jgi:putative heme-binding domain-containing protein
LNRVGSNGQNQLIAFTQSGLIRRAAKDGSPLPPFDAAAADRERKIADPTDESRPLEARARGYLHANCGHCHSDHGGGAVPLRLQFHVPAAEMNAIGIRPTRGDFTLPGASIIMPGNPNASTLYFRMAKFGRDRMPHIGSEWPDEAGLSLVEQWIAAMPGGGEVTSAGLHGTVNGDVTGDAIGDQIGRWLVSPQAALPLARRLARGDLAPSAQDALLTAAAKLEAGPIRDLFEGYLPTDASGQRKLGSSPRPSTILVHPGDALRGESLFWSERVNCGKCHRVGERGTPIGPDLSNIGTLRSREDLLESLLSPSRRIEPKFATYLALTADGRSLSGLLIKRDAAAVVLRDGQGKETMLEASSVQKLLPSRTSLMPDGQMAGLTAPEAADLLEYLATRTSQRAAGLGRTQSGDK